MGKEGIRIRYKKTMQRKYVGKPYNLLVVRYQRGRGVKQIGHRKVKLVLQDKHIEKLRKEGKKLKII